MVDGKSFDINEPTGIKSDIIHSLFEFLFPREDNEVVRLARENIDYQKKVTLEKELTLAKLKEIVLTDEKVNEVLTLSEKYISLQSKSQALLTGLLVCNAFINKTEEMKEELDKFESYLKNVEQEK